MEIIKEPCPVCQSKNISTNTIMPVGNCYIHCDRCGFTTSIYKNIDEAITEWNHSQMVDATIRGKIHVITSYQNTNLKNPATELIIRNSQEKLMSDLSKVLLTATTEGKYILIHPLTFSQHEDGINGKLEVVRKLSYEILDTVSICEEET